MLLYRKKGKIIHFSETIVVYDIKVGRCSYLNEYMNLYEYQRSRSFIDLGPRYIVSKFSNIFSLETAGPIEAKFYVAAPWDRRRKIHSNNPGHTTKMAAMSIYSKNIKQSSSLEPKGR